MKNKFLSVILSAILSVSIIGSANCSAEFKETYTFKELLAMSDDEFASLSGADEALKSIKAVPDESGISENGILSGTCIAFVDGDTSWYKANLTENLLNELLNDSMDYSISSPTDISGDLFYNHGLSVTLTEFNGGIDATNENTAILAKLFYCLQQIGDFSYLKLDEYFDYSSDTKVISGDVNIDEKVDLYDVIWICSHIINKFTLTENQIKIADVNDDGVTDLYDAIEIAKALLP